MSIVITIPVDKNESADWSIFLAGLFTDEMRDFVELNIG